MSDIREAFEAWCENEGYTIKRGFGRDDNYEFVETRRMWQAWQAALSANGGEAGPFVFDRYINGIKMAQGVCIENVATFEKAMGMAAEIAEKGPNGEPPVLISPAPPSVAVPEGWSVRQVEDQGNAGFIVGSPRVNGVRPNTSVWRDDEDPAHQLLAHMLAAAPSPDHSGDANKMVEGFIEDQEPLGAEFEAVYEENKGELYESDDDHIPDAGKVEPGDRSPDYYEGYKDGWNNGVDAPSVPENEKLQKAIADDLELWLSQVRHMEGLSAHDIIESAEDYIAMIRTAGDEGEEG